MGVTKNQKLTLTIESFGAQGEGVAKYEGMPVFVPYALPGEIADVLNVPLSTVLSKHNRGIKRLRKELEGIL